MKRLPDSAPQQPSEKRLPQKETFRRDQRNLDFGEKMRIAFSLAERDKLIRNAVLLSRADTGKKPIGHVSFAKRPSDAET